MWQQLETLDRQLFIALNSKYTNTVFDVILPYFRDSVFWAPLYIFILAFILLNYGRSGMWWCLAFLCTVAITDMVSSRVFKELFERVRPCNEILLHDQVRLLLHRCSGAFSFTSSHAANHFGIATFVSLTFLRTFGKKIYLIYVWAFFVSYAQVYVGVHYPLDVLGGAALGVLAGFFTSRIFKNKVPKFALD